MLNIYMSFTRFNYDEARTKKQLQESISVGLYHLDVPGPGINTPFLEDPHIRLQKWGSNLRTNTLELENDFRGLNRKLERNQKQYDEVAAQTMEKQYDTQNSFVDETRASQPAWLLRDQTNIRWEYPMINYQEHVEIPFDHSESTRSLEKDRFVNKNNKIN